MRLCLDVDVSITANGQVAGARIGDINFKVVGKTILAGQKFAEPFVEMRTTGVLIIGFGNEATFLRSDQIQVRQTIRP